VLGAGGQIAWGVRCRKTLVATLGDIPNGSDQASRRRWFRTHVPIIQHVSNIIAVETLASTNVETGLKL
jgi:hypothetical protein